MRNIHKNKLEIDSDISEDHMGKELPHTFILIIQKSLIKVALGTERYIK